MLTRWIERRRKVRCDAESMLETLPGRQAWHEVRDRGKSMAQSEDERTHWWRVAG